MASFTVGSSHHRVLDRHAHHDGAISRAVDADRLARPGLPSVPRPSADESNSRTQRHDISARLGARTAAEE
jgi:hypothetical protein